MSHNIHVNNIFFIENKHYHLIFTIKTILIDKTHFIFLYIFYRSLPKSNWCHQLSEIFYRKGSCLPKKKWLLTLICFIYLLIYFICLILFISVIKPEIFFHLNTSKHKQYTNIAKVILKKANCKLF